MIEIDLLKFFDKSFSEIDEILHRKQNFNEVFEEKEELSSIVKQKKKSFILKYLTLTTIIIIISFTGYKFYELIKHNLVTIPPKKVKNEQEQPLTNTKSLEVTPHKNITPSYTVHGEDIVIGTIEFLGKNLPPLSIDNTTHNAKTKVPIVPKIENKDKEQQKQLSTTTPEKNLYNVKLYYIDNHVLEDIKRKLQSYPGIELKILGKNRGSDTKWDLYKPTKGTNKYIGSREVAFIKTFNNKNEAIRFAKSRNIPAIIVKKSDVKITYDLLISNFHSKEEALDFVKSFNISKENVGIQKN